MSRKEFIEDCESMRADPLHQNRADFDFDQVCRNIDGEDEEQLRAQRERDSQLRIITTLLHYLVPEGIGRKPNLNRLGRRVLAFVWVVKPELLRGRSLRQIARLLGVGAPTLAKLTGEVSRRLGIVNAAQAHAWNRKKEKR